MHKHLCMFALACTFVNAGCRDEGGPLTPADLSMGGGGAGGAGGMGGTGGSGGSDMAMPMKTYKPTTIAAMRQAKTADVELDNVLAIALTPSTKSPKLFVQDAAGGDFSAIETQCSSSSSAHKCTVAATVAAVVVGHSVTIKGTYFKNNTSGNEDFYVDSIVDNGAATGTAPEPLTLTVADIQRNANVPAKTFQIATVTPGEDLVMYDWSPKELTYQGSWPSGCSIPYMFGFAMAPASANLTAGAACSGTTSQPAASATSDKEVLIGTYFYKNFPWSSDCRCGAMFNDTLPTAGTKWPSSVAVKGIVIFSAGTTADSGYQIFSPLENKLQ
jgi:hypothetical protein